MGIIDELFGDPDDNDRYKNRHRDSSTGILGLDIKNKIKNTMKDVSSLANRESNFQSKKAEKERKKQLNEDIESIMREDYGIQKNPVIYGMGCANDEPKEKESPMKITIRKKLKEIDQMIQP